METKLLHIFIESKILTFRLFETNNILFGHTLSSEDLDLKKIIYNFV